VCIPSAEFFNGLVQGTLETVAYPLLLSRATTEIVRSGAGDLCVQTERAHWGDWNLSYQGASQEVFVFQGVFALSGPHPPTMFPPRIPCESKATETTRLREHIEQNNLAIVNIYCYTCSL